MLNMAIRNFGKTCSYLFAPFSNVGIAFIANKSVVTGCRQVYWC